MIKFEPVPGVIRVPMDDIHPGLYCLVVPAPKCDNFRMFYLMREGIGVTVDMFSCAVESDADAAEIAYSNAPQYIGELIDNCY